MPIRRRPGWPHGLVERSRVLLGPLRVALCRIISTGNNRVLATSERYHNKSGARHAAQVIINGAGNGYIEE
jgi:hypothetical protein